MQLLDPILHRRGMDASKLTGLFCRKSSQSFMRESELEALSLFHSMAERVPAYRDFLLKKGVNSHAIKSYQDLLGVPPTDKDNYITQYSLAELSWDGEIDAEMFSTSSGSSGEAHFWPRGKRLEEETAFVYELLLRNFFSIDKRKTLVIDAYSMGLYVAGTFTLNSCIRIADKGYPLTVITPGINKSDVLKVVQRIGDNFDQIVLCAYPPLAKDIIDEGKLLGIDWARYHMHFISGGESYSEKWRAHLYKSSGVPEQDYLYSSINTYGSADAAILGHETPLSILIRRLASDDKELCLALFGKANLPSFHQYYPFWKNISLQEKELCFTANAGIPLVRYNIHDEGGYYSYDEVLHILKKHGYKSSEVLKDFPPELNWRLPFVYLYGRSNAAATIYGLNVYPENIKTALEHDDALAHLSGKFVLSTEYDKAQDQYLSLHLELKKDALIDRKTSARIRKIVFETLREVNAEFRMLSDTFRKRATPRVRFHSHGDTRHFPLRIKEQYLKKS